MHDRVAWATRRKRSRRRHSGKLPANNRFDEVRLGRGPRINGRRDPAVTENGRAIGDLHHLVDIVRNEDDARAFGDDGAHELEEAVDVAPWKKRGRLVHPQKACSYAAFLVHLRDRADDGEQRPLDGRDVRDARLRVESDGVSGKKPPRGAPLRNPVDRPGVALREPPEQEVLEHCQTRDQSQMLVHEADAILSEFAGREGQRNICAANLQTASRVRRVKPRQNFNERRLATTVLTKKAMHLTRSDLERSLIESLLAPEGLAQVPKPKRRVGRRRRANRSY